MTIGKRLIVLVAVPLVALLGFGIFARIRLSEIEESSRFVAESQLTKRCGARKHFRKLCRNPGERAQCPAGCRPR